MILSLSSSPDLLPHRFQKLLLGEYSLFNKQSAEGLLGSHLGHQEFFKGEELVRVKDDCHRRFRKQPPGFIISLTNTTKAMAAYASIEC